MTNVQTPNEYDWMATVTTHHTMSTLKGSGEVSEDQTKVMQRILEVRSLYNLDSTEFQAILKYVTGRGGYLNNFTCIEDVYFEFAIRLLRGLEMDKWIGTQMCERLNPTHDGETGSKLVTVVEAMRGADLKGDDMFAMAHKVLDQTTTPFKYSSCAVILNTINEALDKTTAAPPGAN